ncbi:MAG: AAA family ATPase [Caldilineaceae bacterium]|nr:AAA family ATPase [Caldilineaceae bacterium]
MIVEIVGSAGVGKTTIARLLQAQLPHLSYISDWRRVSSLSDLAFGVAPLVPLLLPTLWPTRAPRLTRRELTWMGRLCTSRRTLARLAPTFADERSVLLDQGPIYTLMRLAEQRSATAVASEQVIEWQQQMLERWSYVLDGVIWLDAPDAVLVERVFARSKAHWLQLRTREDAQVVLQQHRQLYHRLLEQVAKTGRCRIAHYDTNVLEPAALAAQIGRDFFADWPLVTAGFENHVARMAEQS